MTSFLLVIYYKNRKCLGSGMITGLTNRLGDCFFICVLGFVLCHGSNLCVLVLLVLLGMTKRAQVPFSSWLPSAMAAPTPVRALVHSSTLVTAGVYVLIRFCHLDTFFLIAIGSMTMLLAGIGACAERDLKKVVALRTLSQLGLMMVSIGAREKSFCFFHLMSHAFFKALLFICIGSFIHTVYGTQDFRRFDKMRITSVGCSTFCTAARSSLMGFLFTTGFYRKDIIIEALYTSGGESWCLSLFLLGVGLTSFYSLKMLSQTLMVGALTETRVIKQGRTRVTVKAPLYLLGSLRLIFGGLVYEYCGPITVTIPREDKLIAIGFIGFGSLGGVFLSRIHRPLFRRIFTLTPY